MTEYKNQADTETSRQHEKAVRAVQDFLEALGVDLAAQGMEKTPHRVAEAFEQFFSGLHEDPEAHWGSLIQSGSEGLIAVRNIRFYSICEHHLLPFFGTVHIAYCPSDGKIAGFSHFADVVGVLARRPQLQERFTEAICQAVQHGLGARGTLVIVEGTHLCLSMRSPSGSDSRIVTQAAAGCLREGSEAGQRAWKLLTEQRNDGCTN